MWNQLTIGYLAALIDGEGYIGSSKRITVTVTSKDKDILDRALEMSGIGVINGPYKHSNPKHNQFWTWSIGKHSDIARLLGAITPLLSKRRVETQVVPILDRISKAIVRPQDCEVCEVRYTPKRMLSGKHKPRYCSHTCGVRAHRDRKAVV